jgi:hypothetical protein
MGDALKRIEEKHKRVPGFVKGTFTPAGMTWTQTLEFLDDLEASAVFDEWSIDNEPRAAGAYMLHAEVKRTLEEVAGE